MRLLLCAATVVILALTGRSADAAEPGLVGYWPFDGSLADASGAGRDARGAGARFAPGHKGQALAPGGSVVVPNEPDLALSPGLCLDCWVYWDQQPTGYQPMVLKDQEYQLRVDSPAEGGRFSFFVYLEGWEPRVSGTVPEPGRWYHVIARWSGTETVLEVNGERFAGPRRGIPAATTNPLQIGGFSGRLDDLRLSNPILARTREMTALSAAVPEGRRLNQSHFGGEAGWQGWQAVGGGKMTVRDGLRAALPDAAAALVNPVLNLDLGGVRFLCLDIDAGQAKEATASFLTDQGSASVSFPIWSGQRTSLLDLGSCGSWVGKLRLLALSLPDGKPHEIVLRNLWISREPQGKPFLYVRSLAPGCAMPRAGREEQVVAVLRNLGAAAANVQARLIVPEGVTVLDPASRQLGRMDNDATEQVQWRVRADRPASVTVKVELTAEGFGPVARPLAMQFTPLPNLAKSDYVPAPRPVRAEPLLLMHYCPLWKEGTHYGWEKIEPWPERRPAIGYYDEGTPEVADWQIKYALEHGIEGFIYCWYRVGLDAPIKQQLGHAIHDGLLKARYRDQFKFAIMWENGCGAGTAGREDLLGNLLPFWIKNYFSQPSYVKIDNKPLLYIWVPAKASQELGGSEKTKRVLDEMRAACKRAGFDGLYIVGCVETADRALLQQMGREGWDASSAYGVWGATKSPPGRDVEGITTQDYAENLLGQEQTWRAKKAVGALPDIIDVMMGWDPRPWHGKGTQSYYAPASPAAFKAACERARALWQETPGNGLDKRVVVFDNWCEFGEGHYLEPCAGFGFGYLDAIKEVFCPGAPPCQDITPPDVGLPYPERAYLLRREVLGGFPERQRKVIGGLLAWWRFEEDDTNVALDASECHFHGAKQDFMSTTGKVGKGFLCNGGTVTVPAHRLLWPSEGITIELWYKADIAGQSDRWMVNCVGTSNSGYRLGLDQGKLCWQIPLTGWSHHLTCPDPAPLGQWTHVAATYDGKTMRIYVNGQESASMARPGVINPSDVNLILGNYSPGHPRAFFQGVLDEIKLYDHALTAQEVAEHYQKSR